jgi:hypothetical protein
MRPNTGFAISYPAAMGACMSTNNEEEEQKKRSQAIDRVLDEDSKRLRRECKILLLGELEASTPPGCGAY